MNFSQQMEWHSPPAEPVLRHNQVHVWWASFTGYHSPLNEFERILSPDELERAAKFRFDKDRELYVFRRGFLRKLLGQYLEMSPSKIEFTYNDAGKPEISKPAGSKLGFNLSHSGDQAVFAFSLDNALGVDIEQQRSLPDMLAIAARFFSPKEQEELRGVPFDEIEEAFFRIWTRKEAVVKAVGAGLKFPLEAFNVPHLPISTPGERVEANGSWYLYDLPTVPKLPGALAVGGKGLEVNFWRFEENGL